MNKIFLSVAAYRDPILLQTLCEAAKNADSPERLVFGVVEQREAAERLVVPQRLQKQVRYVGVDPKDARGPCWARAIAMSLYGGESWFLQIDSHMLFDEGWDTYLLENIALCYQHSNKPILTGIPNSIEYDEGVCTKKDKNVDTMVMQYVEEQGFNEEDHVLIGRAYTDTSKSIVPAAQVSGACIFAAGRIVEELPYDPYYYFGGEEQSYSIRAYTHGWDMFHAPGNPLYHLYAEDKLKEVRRQHWEAEQDECRGQRWWDLDNASKKRFSEMLGGRGAGVYGLGTKRTIADFARDFGVDYANKELRKK